MLVYVIQAWFYCLNFLSFSALSFEFLHGFEYAADLLPDWKEFVQFRADEFDRFFQVSHVVCRLGRRRARLSTRHCAAVHVLQMGYATWPVTVLWSADCLA